MRGSEKKSMDALLVLARASFGDRGRRSPARIVVTLFVLLLPLVLPIYLLWPEPEPPPLLLAAFDQVAQPGETVGLCGRVEPLREDGSKANLAGHPIYFHELQTD